jgi:hypothetical protein
MVTLDLHANQLTGTLPAFHFARIKHCCYIGAPDNVYKCPLPVNASRCAGGSGCGGKQPTPTCQ